jgi:hypothetical protein
METVTLKKIISPISGHWVEPKIVTIKDRHRIITEAHWIDPISGAFIRKGIVKVEELKQS